MKIRDFVFDDFRHSMGRFLLRWNTDITGSTQNRIPKMRGGGGERANLNGLKQENHINLQGAAAEEAEEEAKKTKYNDNE